MKRVEIFARVDDGEPRFLAWADVPAEPGWGAALAQTLRALADEFDRDGSVSPPSVHADGLSGSGGCADTPEPGDGPSGGETT